MDSNGDIAQIATIFKRGFQDHSILDTLVPGYSAISNVLKAYLGIDIPRLLPWFGVFFALSKVSTHVYHQFRYRLLQWLSCYVVLDSDLKSYSYVTRFLEDRKGVGLQSSTLVAVSDARPDVYLFNQDPNAIRGQRGTRHVRYPQKYEPTIGYHQHFWHKGKLFVWYLERTRRSHEGSPDTTEARLYCFSRTTAPIKQLIEEATSFHDNKNAGFTTVHRPFLARSSHHGGSHWRTSTTRPLRPMNTVILDETQKSNLLTDIKLYLLPGTRKWYAQRGIPYRRGYLFHGPPGTGKTSLSFSLAGALDLDVYCLSLAERSMTDTALFELFEALPQHCVVLLEDVDTAGLQKRDDKTIGIENVDTAMAQSTSKSTKTVAAEPHRYLSLSGLLNAIDGVSSHEGRVLLMTTNDVGALDQALLRPGRIDVKVHFKKSSKQDAYHLFVQTFMEYDGDSIDEKQEIPAELKLLAEQFALEIPDAKHTPAELQGYLLTWKNQKPEDAVHNVRAWLNGNEVKDKNIPAGGEASAEVDRQ